MGKKSERIKSLEDRVTVIEGELEMADKTLHITNQPARNNIVLCTNPLKCPYKSKYNHPCGKLCEGDLTVPNIGDCAYRKVWYLTGYYV